MGFINIVKNKPKATSSNKPKPAQKSSMQMPKLNTKQMVAIGLMVLGLIFIGIAIMSW